MVSAPPYNNWINKTALGRHTLCLRKGCAGNAPALSVPAKASARARLLSKRYTDDQEIKKSIKARES